MVAVQARTELTPAEREDVAALAKVCDAYEGLHMRLNTGFFPAKPNELDFFLAYDGDRLVGYGSIDPGSDAEVNVMVHPEHRRRGIGRALVQAAATEIARHFANVILICEESSRSGRAFLAALGGRRQNAEYHMILSQIQGERPADPTLQLTVATREDVEVVAHILAIAFGDPEDEVRRFVASEIDSPQQYTILARRRGMPIGTLKVIYLPAMPTIFAFGVLPGYRGQGVGRQMLVDTVRSLQRDGHTQIAIEVDTTNIAAHGLYRSCGFHEVASYGYYELSDPSPSLSSAATRIG